MRTLQAQLHSQAQLPLAKARKGRAAIACASGGQENERPAEANTGARLALGGKDAAEGFAVCAEAAADGRGAFVLALTGLSSKEKRDVVAAVDRLNVLLAKGTKAKVRAAPDTRPVGSQGARKRMRKWAGD